MGLSLDRARNLADRLCMELLARSPDVDRATAYYRGDQPLKFASAEFASYFGKRYERFSDNWCQVVADAPVERLEVTGVKPFASDKADVDSWRTWQENGLDLDSQMGFLGAGNGARAFVLVWGDPAIVTFEDASQAIVAYAPGSRRIRVAGAKRWVDGSTEFVTLYMADEVWKFERPVQSQDKTPGMAAVDEDLREWKPRQTRDEPNPQPNPMGRVPLVELPNRPLLVGEPISDVLGTISMQDAINLLWAQTLTAADFQSFRQRVVLGAEMPTFPVLNDRGEKIDEKPLDLKKFAVDRVLWIEDPNATISEWGATDLSNYTGVLEVAVGHVAAQTRTPAHYLIGKMSNLSSDALIAAETGLVKKCQEKMLWYGAGLREMFALIALAQGNEAKASDLAAGSVIWADAESRNQAQLADSLTKLKSIGFPFEWLAAKYGLTPLEVAELVLMQEREAERDPLAAMMSPKLEPADDEPVDDQPVEE